MKKTLLHLILISHIFAQVFVTEIERNPPGSESEAPGGKSHEYIEMINLGNTPIRIDSLAITDGIVINQLIPRTGKELLPGGALLVLDPDYFEYESIAPIGYPIECEIATISHTSLCGGLSSSDGFNITSGDSILASVSDSGELSEGDKITFTTFDGNESDGNVLIPRGLFLDSRWYLDDPSPGETQFIREKIFREYFLEEGLFKFVLQSFDSDFEIDIVISGKKKYSYAINTNERVIDSVPIPDSISSLVVTAFSHKQTVVDTINLTSIRVAGNTVSFSEISPKGETEWIEIHNSSNEDVVLYGWKIANDEDTFSIGDNEEIVSGEYLVVGESLINHAVKTVVPDEWFSLNNYSDTLYLISPWGVEDSVHWDHNRFQSWEYESLHRIDGSDGFSETALVPGPSTPGAGSEVPAESTPITLACIPELFSPNSDGVDDTLHIKVTKPAHYSTSIRIFSVQGVEVKKFSFDGTEGFWDGSTNAGTTARRGPYVILAEFSSLVERPKVLRNGIVLWR